LNNSTTSPVRTGVIGVGYLGRFHAQKYAALDQAELVGVCDTNESAAQKVAGELHTRAFTHLNKLIDQVDALSIVVPTQLHYDIARTCLEAGKHILLEKPMTATVEQAQALIDLAAQNNCLLQIGHLERFNPVVMATDKILKQPLFIESHRVAPFNPRGADVNVILDLMIHDIDIILNMVNDEVKRIDANGAAVLSNDIDIANVRLAFENGCVANVTASRAGMKSERKMRLFQHDAYITIDFQNKKLGVHRKGSGEMYPGVADIESDEAHFEQGDALLAEITSFLDCIVNDAPPVVTGEDGRRALATAIEITRLLKQAQS
jgi:predicted dehydrogenase